MSAETVRLMSEALTYALVVVMALGAAGVIAALVGVLAE
jgi:hypothetical protein